MPFYLVTHSSLIEAETADAAAHIAIERIRAGSMTAVSVTSDETTTDRVIVGERAGTRVQEATTPLAGTDASLSAQSAAGVSQDTNKKSGLNRLVTDIRARFSGRR